MFTSNIRKSYLFNFFISFHLFSGVLIPFFVQWGGLTLTQVFLLETWFLVASVILEVPTGVIADFFGRKISLALGALIASVSALVYASYPSLPIFILGEFLFALALALHSGADHAFIFDSLKADKKSHLANKTVGRFESSGLLAMAAAAPLGSIIGGLFGPRFGMMLFSIPAILAFFVSLTFREPPRLEGKNESRRLIEIFKQGVKTITGRRRIQWIALDLAVVQSLSFLMIWLYQPLLMKFNVPIFWFGIIHAGLTLAQILAIQIYPLLEKFVSRKFILAATAAIPAVMFLVTGLSSSLFIIIPAILLIIGLGLSRQPLVSEELNNMIKSQDRATVLSFVALSRRLIRAGVSPLVGFLADRSLSFAISGLGIIMLSFFFFRTAVLHAYERKGGNNEN